MKAGTRPSMCMNDREPTDMTSLGLGDTEREWLTLVRLNCMSFERNDAEGWNQAISHAESIYGADAGPLIAARVAALIRAMRSERNGGFGYLSPFCPNCRLRATEDEWHLVQLMRAGCADASGEIEATASEFAQRPAAPLLASAAQRFGSQFAAIRNTKRISSPQGATLH
jgi:hypothetical protein